MDSETICRACLTNITIEYIDLDTPFEEDTILEIFNYCTKLDAKLDDELPSNICVPCGTSLQIAHEFIKVASKADRMLRDFLVQHDSQVPTEDKSNIESIRDNVSTEGQGTIFQEDCIESLEEIKEEQIEIEFLEQNGHEEFLIEESIEEFKTKQNDSVENHSNIQSGSQLGELAELLYLSDVEPSEVDEFQYENEEPQMLKNDQTEPIQSDQETNRSKKTVRKQNRKKEKPPYICETCGKVYKSFQSRNRHSFLTHQQQDGQEKKCDLCNFSTSSMSSWLSHKYRHKRPIEKKYLCAYCPMAFINPKTLYMHEDYKHGNKEKALQCEKCEKKFLNKQKLKAHILSVHTSGRNYQCPMCPKTFKNNFQLRAHEKLHTGRSIDCPQCEKKFVRHVDLKVHMRTHTGELPFQCNLCDKRYAIKVRLTYHMQKHLGTKHKCEHCTSEFNSKPKLRLHMFTHIGMPFVCDHCKMGYPTRLELRRHSKNVHKIILTDEDLLQNRIKNEKNLQRGIVSKSALLTPSSPTYENDFEI